MLISCFLAFGCIREECVSLSDDLGTPESFTDLTAFTDFAVLLFIVHEHWGIQPIHIISCHPLTLLVTHLETGGSDLPAYASSTASNGYSKLPIDFCVFGSMLSNPQKFAAICFVFVCILPKLFHSYGWHSSSRPQYSLLTT